jgi:hypothetical protein
MEQKMPAMMEIAGIFWGISFGAPGEIRTPDTLVRSQVLYPAELRAQSEKNLPKATPILAVLASTNRSHGGARRV